MVEDWDRSSQLSEHSGTMPAPWALNQWVFSRIEFKSKKNFLKLIYVGCVAEFGMVQ